MIKTLTIIWAIAALFVAGCGNGTDQSANGAPAGQQAPAQAQSSDHGWLWALGGFLMGRATAPKVQAPVVMQQPGMGFASPAAQPRPVPRPWWRGDKPVNDPVSPPAVAKAAPAPTPAPKPALPAPTVAQKPSYSGPSSYKPAPAPRVTYSQSFSRPSSSGRR